MIKTSILRDILKEISVHVFSSWVYLYRKKLFQTHPDCKAYLNTFNDT